MFTIIPGDFNVPINDTFSLESPHFLPWLHILLLQAIMWLTLDLMMAENFPIYDLLNSQPMAHRLVLSQPLFLIF